jgi:hypothetical protein
LALHDDVKQLLIELDAPHCVLSLLDVVANNSAAQLPLASSSIVKSEIKRLSLFLTNVQAKEHSFCH